MVPLLFLLHHDHISQIHLCFHMDNVAAVQCVCKMGSSRSLTLLIASEKLFRDAAARHLSLSAVHLPGHSNVWVDALSRTQDSSMEWTLQPDAFQDIVAVYGEPEVDLFASEDNHQLPHFLTRTVATESRGPDALRVPWERWRYVYPFLLPQPPSWLQCAAS